MSCLNKVLQNCTRQFEHFELPFGLPPPVLTRSCSNLKKHFKVHRLEDVFNVKHVAENWLEDQSKEFYLN